MEKKRIIKCLAVLLLVCLLPGMTGCGGETPVETTPAETQAATEPVIVDDRTWGQKAIQTYADYAGIPYEAYPESFRNLMEAQPEAMGFVLAYPYEHDKPHEIDMSEYADCDTVPLFIQWDKRWGYIEYGADVAGITGCGPLSLSMVAYYLTRDEDMSPDKIIQFAIDEKYCVKGNGSAWTLISRGAEKLGLRAKELPLVERRIRNELLAGNPVICVMGPGIFTSSGHFIVLTGYEDGMYRINDPNSIVRSGKLWSYEEFQDQVRNLWAISLPS